MATVFWYGTKTLKRAGRPFTVVYAAGQTITITLNGKDFAYTALASDTTAAAVVAGLVNAGQASKESNHSECSFRALDNVFYIDGPTDGGNFSSSAAASAGSCTAGTYVTGTSPNDLNDVGNYSSGALPANNDTLQFPTGRPDVRYNLDALDGITGLNLVREAGGPKLGLPDKRANGQLEWRATRITTPADTVSVYLGQQDPAQAVRLDLMSTAATVEVIGVGASPSGQERCEVVGVDGVGTDVRVNNGSLAVCTQDGNATDSIPTLRATNSTLRVGQWGVTAAVLVYGGVARIAADFTTLTVDEGATVIVEGTATGTPVVEGGQLFWNSTGDLASPVISSGATLNLDGGAGAVAVTGVVTRAADDAVLIDNTGRIVRPYDIENPNANVASQNLQLGNNYKMTVDDI